MYRPTEPAFESNQQISRSPDSRLAVASGTSPVGLETFFPGQTDLALAGPGCQAWRFRPAKGGRSQSGKPFMVCFFFLAFFFLFFFFENRPALFFFI